MYINHCNITDNKPRNKYEIFSLKEIQKNPKNHNIKKNTKKTQRKEINFCGIVKNKNQELPGIRFL